MKNTGWDFRTKPGCSTTEKYSAMKKSKCELETKLKAIQSKCGGPCTSCIPTANKTSTAWAGGMGRGGVILTFKSKKWACVGCLPCMYDCHSQSHEEIISLLSQPLISHSPFPTLLRYPMSQQFTFACSNTFFVLFCLHLPTHQWLCFALCLVHLAMFSLDRSHCHGRGQLPPPRGTEASLPPP